MRGDARRIGGRRDVQRGLDRGRGRGHQTRSHLVALLLTLVCVFALTSAPALAGGSSNSSGSSGSSPGALNYGGTPTTPTATNADTISVPKTAGTSTSAGGSGFSGTEAFVIIALVVIVGGSICAYILYDARRHAPKRTHESTWDPDGGVHAGSKAPRKSRKLSAAEKKRRKQGRAPTKRRK